MNYATIKNCDIANGPGVRVSLFVSGCTHHCPGCFNEVAWDFGYGEPFTQQTIDTILDMLRPDYIRGLTLLGGEPFEPENQGAILELLRQIKREMPKKSIWAFSGYLFEKDILSGRLGDTREATWTSWWTDPLWRQRKICPCDSGVRKTSGSLTSRHPWPREKPSSGRTGRGKREE